MRIILGLVFSVSLLLLIPLGYQSVFAGAPTHGPHGTPDTPIPIDPPGPPGIYDFDNFLGFGDTAGPQIKHFLAPNFGAAPNFINERITNTASIPISDWHERLIHYPSVVWLNPQNPLMVIECGTGVPGVPGQGIPLPNAIVSPMSNDEEIWIDFDPPILQGQCFEIEKQFQIIGTLPNPWVEVEEFPTALDFGDLPDAPHPTLFASDGARHVITGAKMGGLIDGEPDGQPNAAATGDGADEDGFISGGLDAGTMDTVTVITNVFGDIHVFMGQGGALAPVGSKIGAPPGLNAITVDLTSGFATSTLTDIRVRFCTTGDCASITGLSMSGEVEDYIETTKAGGGGPPNPVGGTGVPISATSLALAGIQSNYSILMALTAVGFGAFAVLYYSTKKKSD